MPGRITRNGKNILGIAAMSGVRRAADIESAAIARCTTRKSVHQYPNDSTKPSPITIPNTSTPIGLAEGLFINLHDSDHAPDPNPLWVATTESLDCSPDHPPASFSPSKTSGKNPSTIRKNCNTSL